MELADQANPDQRRLMEVFILNKSSSLNCCALTHLKLLLKDALTWALPHTHVWHPSLVSAVAHRSVSAATPVAAVLDSLINPSQDHLAQEMVT